MNGSARQPWLDAGFRILKEEGHSSLTLDRLCAAANKTKGSFYHHFPSLDRCFEMLLAAWEESMTQAPIRAAEAEGKPEEQTAILEAEVSIQDHSLDQAIRAWGRHHPIAKAAVIRVDALRVDFLARLHMEAGRARARDLAHLEYATFLGMQQLDLQKPAEAAAVKDLLREALSHRSASAPVAKRPPASPLQ